MENVWNFYREYNIGKNNNPWSNRKKMYGMGERNIRHSLLSWVYYGSRASSEKPTNITGRLNKKYTPSNSVYKLNIISYH